MWRTRCLGFAATGLAAFGASAAEISVRGTADQSQFADQWDVSFDIFVQKPSKREAIEIYNAIKPKVEAIVSKSGDAEILESNLSSQPWFEWVKERETLRGWEITHSYTVRYTKQDRGTDDVQSLSSQKNVSIKGITPELKKGTLLTLRNQVLAQAYADAYGKAVVLAKSLGANIKKVSHVEENGVAESREAPQFDSYAAVAKVGVGARAATFTLDPVKIPVHQAILLKVDTD